MASLREIKKRIQSVKNIGQITKAMEVVSMTKMRKSQAAALSARPYAAASLDILKNLVERTPVESLPVFFKQLEVKKSLLIVITSDKGLVGGFNDTVLRRSDAWLQKQKSKGNTYDIITVGKKAEDYFIRKGSIPVQTFIHSGDSTTISETEYIATKILQGFKDGLWQNVDIIYTNFRSTLRQEVVERTALPIKTNTIEEIVKDIVPEYGKYADLNGTTGDQALKYDYEYAFEPNAEEILSLLVTDLLRVLIHHVILESNASEHSARMLAMQNASKNADDVGETLTLDFNKARQGSITRELTEIIAGAEAQG